MEQVHQDRTGDLARPVSARLYEGRVARVHGDGDPLRYEWGDEFRDVAGIQEIAAELQVVKPFSLLHPSDLIAKGTDADVVGKVIGARIDGDFVIAQILVTDPRAITAIDGGMHELSLGYTSQLDSYRRQRNIKVDHLALVPRARCGAVCALRADSVCTCNNRAISYNTITMPEQANPDVVQPGIAPLPASVPAARNIVMDQLEKRLGEALASAAEQKARADQLESELKVAKAALTVAEVAATNSGAALASEKKLTEAANARADQAKQDADLAITQAKLDAQQTVSGAVAARVQLLVDANQVLGTKDGKGQLIDRSAMDDQAIRLAVIKHVDNLDFPKDKDPVFVQGVYAGSLARSAAASASRVSVREATVRVRADAERAVQRPVNAARDAEMAAQKAMTDDQANRWRTKAN